MRRVQNHRRAPIIVPARLRSQGWPDCVESRTPARARALPGYRYVPVQAWNVCGWTGWKSQPCTVPRTWHGRHTSHCKIQDTVLHWQGPCPEPWQSWFHCQDVHLCHCQGTALSGMRLSTPGGSLPASDHPPTLCIIDPCLSHTGQPQGW